MKPQYANLQVDCWVHHGKLGFSPTSLCLGRDSIHEGSEILAALQELKAENFPGRLQLTLANRRNEGSVTSLRLMHVPARDDLRVMCIRFESGSATIEMTDIGLRLMIDAVGQWLKGAEDFGVSPRNSPLKPKDLGDLDRLSAELWFWGPCYAGP